MSINFKKILYTFLIIILVDHPVISAENLKSVGKFKDWEAFTMTENDKKVCFAQSIPLLRAPKKHKRDPSRLFVTFRPSENIKNEVSVTNGYMFKVGSAVQAKSGKRIFDLFTKDNFAWLPDNEDETKMISKMKKASRFMIVGITETGSQTTDHYSMMGFTKAFNTAKKSCS